MTDDLVAFLRDRLDEDEQVAKSVPHSKRIPCHDDTTVWVQDDDYRSSTIVIDEGRLLDEVVAKRQIIELCENVQSDPWSYDLMAQGIAEDVLQALAQPHAYHPQFREGWKT